MHVEHLAITTVTALLRDTNTGPLTQRTVRALKGFRTVLSLLPSSLFLQAAVGNRAGTYCLGVMSLFGNS